MEVTEKKGVKWLRRALRTLAVVVLALVAYLVIAPTGRYLLRAGWEEGKILAQAPPDLRHHRRSRHAGCAAREAPARPRRARLRARLARPEHGRELHDVQPVSTATRSSSCSPARTATSCEARTWWFPVVGRVPYKGYFDFAAARAAERDLTAQGFDARLGAASAFSTLGWFNDPLLPTTLRADSLTVANTVIHELTHNTFYAPGGAVFNESFANFVGSRGAQRFFLARGQPAAAQQVVARWEDEKSSVASGPRCTRASTRRSRRIRARSRSSGRSASPFATRIYAQAREQLRDEIGPQLRHDQPRAVERVRSTTPCSWRGGSTSRTSMRSTRCSPRAAAICDVPSRRSSEAAKSDRKNPFDAVKALAPASAQH